MRQIQLRQPPAAPAGAATHAPAHGGVARRAAPEVEDPLDRAAALWTTRRIRSFLMLLDPPARALQR